PDDRGGSRRADTGEDEVQVADKDLDRHGCIGFFTTKAAAVPQPEVDVDEVAGRLDIPGVEVEQMMHGVHAVAFGRPDVGHVGELAPDGVLVADADGVAEQYDAFFHGGAGGCSGEA